MQYFDKKNNFSTFFLNYFSTSKISKIFSRIFFPDSNFRVLTFLSYIFRKNTFLKIFLKTKSRNVRFNKDILFLVLFKKKNNFRKIENFFGTRYPNFLLISKNTNFNRFFLDFLFKINQNIENHTT